MSSLFHQTNPAPHIKRHVWWATLPFVITAVFISIPLLSAWLEINNTTWLAIVNDVAPWVLLAAFLVGVVWMFITTRKEGITIWNAAWYSLGLLLLMIAVIWLAQVLINQYSRNTDMLPLIGMPFVILAFLLALTFYRKDALWTAALPFIYILWSPVLEFVPIWYSIPVHLIALLILTLASIWLVRNPRSWAVPWVSAGAIALVGLVWSVMRSSIEVLPYSIPEERRLIAPPLNDILQWWLPGFIGLTGGLILPALFRQFHRYTGLRRGWLIAMTAGLLTNLAAGLVFVMGSSQNYYWFAENSTLIRWVGYTGALVFVVGAVLEIARLYRSKGGIPTIGAALIAALLLHLPVLVMAPFIMTLSSPRGIPLPYLSFSYAQPVPIYALGLLVVFVSLALLSFDQDRA